jgi:hypothetical protein
LVLPLAGMGIGMAFIWSPLAATATRNLPPQLAGAGSGVYNTTRQVGSVLGSASMAAFMTWRISYEMPPMPMQAQREGSVTQLPAWLHEPFAAAMSQSLLLPAFFALFGVIAAMFLLGFGDPDRLVEDDVEDADRDAGYAVEYGGDEAFMDDDEYLEYEVRWDHDDLEPATRAEPVVQVDDTVTEPIRSRNDHLLHAPAEAWHSDPVESWHSLLDDQLVPPAKPKSELIGFAHNGFHVDDDERFQPLPESKEARPHQRRARHYRPENQADKRPFWFESNGRHSRDDASRHGRHSMPGLD